MAWIMDNLRGAIEACGRFNPFGRADTALPNIFTHQLAIAAYMSSGMLRKVITIPAGDRTREWRDWQADKDDIAKIEAEEKRLGLRQKVKHAEILRGIGGGALILITAGNHAEPLNPETIKPGGLVAVNVVSRWQMSGKDWNKDLASPDYGTPGMWQISGDGNKDIHPSRVICFRGDPVPAGLAVADEEAFWGDSRLMRVFNEVTRSDSAQGWFAELVKKAKLTRIGIPDLDNMDEARVNKRVRLIAEGEGILDATVFRSGTTNDPGETITDYQVTWNGIPAVMDAFDQRVAAVGDIPFTRLMGRSPAGMNATGKSDMDNWDRAVGDGQENETRPCLEKLDPILIRSAGAAKPEDVTWTWAPLWTPTEKEEADTFKTTVEALVALQNTGTIPEVAFAEATQNLMVEREYMPGLDQALEKIPEDERYGLNPEPDDTDPSEILNGGKEVDPTSAGGGTPAPRSARRAAKDARFTDAKPRTLYGRRDVMPVTERALRAWAKAQGLPELLDGLHVTICHIDQPFDWMKIEGDWNQSDKGEMTIQPGGVRIVEELGNRTAVLLFTSSQLSWRHEIILRSAEAQDKFPQYQPHISLTGEPVDLSNVEPYRGPIVLGPEIFEETRGGGDLSQAE